MRYGCTKIMKLIRILHLQEHNWKKKLIQNSLTFNIILKCHQEVVGMICFDGKS